MAPEIPSVGVAQSSRIRETPHQWAELQLSGRVVRQLQRQSVRDSCYFQNTNMQGSIKNSSKAISHHFPTIKVETIIKTEPAINNDVLSKGESVIRRESIIKKESVIKREPIKRELSESELEYYEEERIGADDTLEDDCVEDNDLTNLTWLQDSNLLRSINLTKGENDEIRPVTIQISPQNLISGASPTSDYLEDSFTSEPADSNSSDHLPTSPCPSPSLHTPVKNLIPSGLLTSNKNSGSASKLKHPHNVPYNPLVHTQNKPPYSFSCLIFMAIEDSPKKALPVKDIYSWILEHFPYFRNAPNGWKNSVRHNLSLNKCFLKVEKVQSLGKGSLWMVDDHYRSNLLQAFSRSPFHPCCPTLNSPSQSQPPSPVNTDITPDRVSATEINGTKGAPNPELFPFLSRRLAASTHNKTPPEIPKESLSDHDSCDSLDEFVAAAMVLALKHGPGVLPPPLISSCPTQDHTYSAATGSPETGYGSDEEQRRTAETLLHLAGLPPAPESTSEVIHRPRLLRRAPKRPSQGLSLDSDNNHYMMNNNCGNQTDRNLSRTKRSRQHYL